MSDENYQRLQGLSEGRSLDETITHLLSTYDKDEERNGLGAQAIKLDELDEFLNAIRSQFAALLSSCQNAKEVVRSEFRKELEERNLAIEDLKEELLKVQRESMHKEDAARAQVEQLRVQTEDQKNKIGLLKEQARNNDQMTAQKQQVIDSMSAALSAAEKKAAMLEDVQKQLAKSEESRKELSEQNRRLSEEKAALSNQLAKTEADYQEELRVVKEQLESSAASREKELEALRNEAQDQLAREEERHNAQSDALRTQMELSVREAKIQAQSQINEIKEEYQNKLFELMMKDKTE
jgi:DNA repair exonuclease SbcCD ATPase subunit